MIKTIVAVVRLLGDRAVILLELIGVAFVVVGLAVAFGGGAAWIGAGVAVLAKSLEVDLKRGDGG